jgi:hypothetical protein
MSLTIHDDQRTPRAAHDTPPCEQWMPAAQRHCGDGPTRRYIVGYRCGSHTPAALAGMPEPPSRLLAVAR